MILLDTHVLIHFVSGEELGPNANDRILRELDDVLLVSAITPWEIAMLTSKQRLELTRPPLEWIEEVLKFDEIRLAPIEPAIAVDAAQLTDMHRDPADRLIVATARYHQIPLLTHDGKIIACAGRGLLEIVDARF